MAELSKNTVLRWIIYLGSIIVSLIMWRDIENNFKFPINNFMWCPGFGSVTRCNNITKACKITITASIACLFSSFFCTLYDGFFLSMVSRFETGVCIVILGMQVGLFCYMIKWIFQTGAILIGESEFLVLFCYVIMLICLFYMAMLISFTEMAYREAFED